MPQHSTGNSSDSPPWVEGYEAARRRVGVIDRRGRGRLVVKGGDRRSYLQGLLTNDIEALGSGLGCYAAYLTAQGRMIADLWVYELGDAILLTMIADVTATVLSKLDQFIFSEDVQIGDVSEAFASIVLVGPQARACVAQVVDDASTIAGLAEDGNMRTAFRGEPVIVLNVSDCGVPGYELLVGVGHIEALRAASVAAGAEAVPADAVEALRIEGGVAAFHRDMDEETIPLEAGIEGRAISQTKGCYVGQEVIVRVLHRGHGRVARRLVGLVLEATEAPSPGAGVTANSREIGHVTSSTYSPALGTAIALAYLHRDFFEVGTRVMVGSTHAVVAALPFVASATS